MNQPAPTPTPARNNQWAMNCILFGANIMNQVREGKNQEVLEKIRGLSSEIDEGTANYLLFRLKELA